MDYVCAARDQGNPYQGEKGVNYQTSFFGARTIAWFSCGAASAVAAKYAVQSNPQTIVAYCDTFSEEHPDNRRFLADVGKWIGKQITILSSREYKTPREVFEQTRYMSGPNGARCTTELKKQPRLSFQEPDDIHIFGFTADEGKRIAEFEQNNSELRLRWILRDLNITKQNCYQIISDAGIRLPELYLMGYPHNNCIGCVKSKSPGYWNKIRVDFPAMFASRAEQSRRIGCRLVEVEGERIFLDELDPKLKGRWKDEVINCGPDCGQRKICPPSK